ADVVFSVTNPDGTTPTEAVTTDAPGTAVQASAPATAGTVTVEASVGGTEINNSPATATFVAGAVDHDNSSLAVTKDNAVADGVRSEERRVGKEGTFRSPRERGTERGSVRKPDGQRAQE